MAHADTVIQGADGMTEHDSGAHWAEPFPNHGKDHRETEDERLLESVE